MRKLLIWTVLLMITPVLSAQEQLSPRAEVSVITCGPGDQLYSSFGHSAFRIADPVLRIDRVYNYGTFDFDAPNFYLNFARGNMIYMLSVSDFSWFLRVYSYEDRWVKSQVLDLKPDEVQAFYTYLEKNARPNERKYLYDFFYDNCATRMEDVTRNVLGDKVAFTNDHLDSNKSHRDLIDDYAHDFAWGKFGIDLALGSVIDDRATYDEYKFLPDYLYESYDHATILRNGKKEPLVREVRQFLEVRGERQPPGGIHPLTVTLVIGFLLVWLTYRDVRRNGRNRTLDVILFFLTGLLGVALLLLWFATTHTATYWNLNILWAFAPNIVVAFYLRKKMLPNWIASYLKVLLLLLIALAVFWIFGVQVFNIALLPVFLALFLRYAYLIKILRRE